MKNIFILFLLGLFVHFFWENEELKRKVADLEDQEEEFWDDVEFNNKHSPGFASGVFFGGNKSSFGNESGVGNFGNVTFLGNNVPYGDYLVGVSGNWVNYSGNWVVTFNGVVVPNVGRLPNGMTYDDITQPGKGLFRDWRRIPEGLDVNKIAQVMPAHARHLAPLFYKHGIENGINPLFLVAISQHETGGWTSNAFRNYGNTMGISHKTGVSVMDSVDESIRLAARSLAGAPGTSNFYKDAQNVAQAISIYSPIGAQNDPRGYNKFAQPYVASYLESYHKQLNLD